ncbi:MAG: ATP-binding protein [Anaerolineae bacterium]|nr:ATP-binding protein [Anaerolineae bacterium]
MMMYERLVQWAADLWETRFPGQRFVTLRAAVECGNMIAHSQVKAGRKLRGKARYTGYEEIECPVITPISDYGARGNKMVLTATAGAYLFHFTDDGATSFDVIYAAAYYDDDMQDLVSIALVPSSKLETWAAFEAACTRAVRPRIRRRRDVYVIGGADAFFDPTVDWEDVILPAELKTKLLDDMQAFFTTGVPIYRQLKLPPFRKLLLAGVPGTGKTMLCAAMARLAIQQGCVVVYVSGADRDGASFEKIQRALQAVAAARYPVLMIVEELDAYLRGDDKARILNVLDGIESPNNPQGALMLATTNYPEAIDERITKRPGRVDRIFIIPTIQDAHHAELMLRHYMGEQWRDEQLALIDQLVEQPGAFVREVALHARMLAAHEHKTEVTMDMLEQSITTLLRQIRADADFLQDRRPISMVGSNRNKRTNPFGWRD